MAKGETYEQFTDKFKPKKTTDDCITPPGVYAAVAAWVSAEYGLDVARFVRPFWPGGDYRAFDYPPGCVVVDNPPFSILVEIQRVYIARGIPFFLFAPTMTLFSGRGLEVCYIPVGVTVTYENGAEVNSSFVTNLQPGTRLRTAPGLYRAVKAANDAARREASRQMPKYRFPPHVLTAAAAYRFSRLGIDFSVPASECRFIKSLDAMEAAGKGSGIFGGALLLSERAAAERAAATVWRLSERERAIVAALSADDPARPRRGLFIFPDDDLT